MGILSGIIKTKRYRKLENGNYQLQSDYTHSDTVEFDDNTTLTVKISNINEEISEVKNNISSHKQSASSITSGVFDGDVSVPSSTSYAENQLRNTVFTTEDPGAGATVSYANGSIICVYE